MESCPQGIDDFSEGERSYGLSRSVTPSQPASCASSQGQRESTLDGFDFTADEDEPGYLKLTR